MIAAIVQARYSSTRLAGKVLEDIEGRPMLWHVVSRVQAAETVDRVLVATSTNASDDAVEELCRREGFECVRGSEDDVLDRYHETAVRAGCDVVVRITADCPLMDPSVVDRVVRRFLQGDCDYATNTLRYTYPDGLDVEVFSFAALERAWNEAKQAREREHVTPYIRLSGAFRCVNVEADEDLSRHAYRWTVDHPADLAFVRSVYRHLYVEGAPPFGLAKVLQLLREHPELQSVNNDIVSNEGAYISIAKSAPVPVIGRKLDRSRELGIEALKVIPTGTQTFSKGPTQYVQGVAPTFIARGDGCHVWDVDGNEYIDYPMALGPVILGYNYPAVTEAAVRQMQDGSIFSLAHPLEVEVAQLLVELIPSAEMVRFAKNGSDATAGAVRAARAYTGREVVAACGYHGWQDWFIGSTTRNRGVPEAVQKLVAPFAYNDIASLERIVSEHRGNVAAVIMEPVGIVPPKDGFLEQVRELTRREGIVLIYDEVITGFRLALGGAQEHYGVTPDLTCVGKAMGNGFPIAAIAGRRDLMEIFDEIFFSFTFGGEAVSLAAAKATIHEMQTKDVVAHLWSVGLRLRDGFNVLAKEFSVESQIKCIGLGPRTSVSFSETQACTALELKSLFQQECLKRGVLFGGGHNISYSHSLADIDHTLHVYRTALELCAVAVREGDVVGRLEGPAVQPVFRQP